MQKIDTPFSDLKNKTKKVKDWYCVDFIKIFCHEINPNDIEFNSKDFIFSFKKKYKELELKQRLNLISDLINEYIQGDYLRKIKVLSRLLNHVNPYEEGMFHNFFFLYPFSQFIEKNGTLDVQLSLKTIEQLTMRFTGEWAIRPLANHAPKTVIKQMRDWSKHSNFHVRRLSSEGLRAKLPWGMKIEWINKNPEKSISIYNRLRNDKSLYVRRSVANSMGDMIKINEELAYKTILNWLYKKHTLENLWVIRHAIRHPIKHKNPKYLKLELEIKNFKSKLR